MKYLSKLALITLATVALAGCQSNVKQPHGSMSTPSIAEQACLRDVTRTTNNPDVVLLGSEPYQGGARYVRVGVGSNRAVWQCIGHSNGTTSEIMSLTKEGSL